MTAVKTLYCAKMRVVRRCSAAGAAQQRDPALRCGCSFRETAIKAKVMKRKSVSGGEPWLMGVWPHSRTNPSIPVGIIKKRPKEGEKFFGFFEKLSHFNVKFRKVFGCFFPGKCATEGQLSEQFRVQSCSWRLRVWPGPRRKKVGFNRTILKHFFMRKSISIPGRRAIACPLPTRKFSLIQVNSGLFRLDQVKARFERSQFGVLMKVLTGDGPRQNDGQKSTRNTGNTGNTLVDAIAINRKHGNIFASKPETGNKVPLQVLAAQGCNLLPETILLLHTYYWPFQAIVQCGVPGADWEILP